MLMRLFGRANVLSHFYATCVETKHATGRRRPVESLLSEWRWFNVERKKLVDQIPPRVGFDTRGYSVHYSRSHVAVIHVYDDAGNVIETHEHKGDFKDW
jgi:hypothetical protein